ncbi:armadillo-type protein, partial [Zychaea mexicana]|uniref:armadillo-type protein n=1 Tax=Zychaea mexicana TaxID=64656 RepID=UPI0022FF1CDE
FPLLLLKLISDNGADMTLRFAGSLYFKNYIKRHWDNENADKIAPQDRQTIKAQIVDLLISVPEKIQLQISDALAIMADEDFPDKWDNLLDQLIGRLSPSDYNVNNGILQIAHSIFKRWRSQFASDNLFLDI